MLRHEDCKEFSFSPDELDLDLSLVKNHFRNTDGSLPDEVGDIIRDVYLFTREKVEIRCGYFLNGKPGMRSAPHTLSLGGHFFFLGEKVFTQIRRSGLIAVFYASVGTSVAGFASHLHENGDFMRSYIMDVISAIIIERSLDRLHEHLAKEARKIKMAVSNRFSPGYCHWDSTDKKGLFSLFPKGFCNLRVNGEEIIDTSRSIAGIIGIGTEIVYQPYECNQCTTINCIMRSNRPLKEAKRET
jgi:hypothetical protein